LPRSRRHFLQQATAFSLTCISARHLIAQQTGQHGDHDAMPGMSMATVPPGSGQAPPAEPMLHSLQLPPFVDALPLPRAAVATAGAPHRLRIAMREVHARVHRDLPPARQWAYVDANAAHTTTALAPLIEAHSGQLLHIEWLNQLPQKHFLPVDFSLHGCGHDIPEVRAIAHLHGARTRTADDGYPEDWFVPGKSLTCLYPMQQDAATLWYHDHAMGLNRLNMYAGLFGLAIIRDTAAEAALDLPTGAHELPLILYDRDFTAAGQLFYPDSGDPNHPWVPEFDGDAILINGKMRPFHAVEPRTYRLRLLNTANSRFFRLSIVRPDAHAPNPHDPVSPVAFHQIGSDQGLLAAPVELKSFTFAPGERVDLLVDFSAFAGQNVHLRNGAFDILQFRVSGTPAAAPKALPPTLRPSPTPHASTATVTRTITLNEYQDKVHNSMLMLLNRKRWHEPTTELPKLNSTEIWEFVNLTEDVHPMHLHLVRFQILDRRPFDTFAYIMHKDLAFTGPALPPDANEAGWKDVVQCSAGMITRILVKFEGYTGKYLYHCHILEHEANDMMRPFEVVA
jgi:spore coat protein A